MLRLFSAKQGDLQLALELEGCLEELQAIHVTKQVLQAVAFLHDNNIVHLDIKVIECPPDEVSSCPLFAIFYLASEYSSDGKMAEHADQTMRFRPLACADQSTIIGNVGHHRLSR